MAYDIQLKPAANRGLKKCSKSIQRRIRSKIDALADDPRPAGVEKLSRGDEDYYRVRCGDYRIIYEIEDESARILVIVIGHRREIYKRMPK